MLYTVPAVRVSSAQARGAAKKYNYWGVSRYTLKLRKNWWHACPCERASSDRRSLRLCRKDAERVAAEERRFMLRGLGLLGDQEVSALYRWLGWTA